jgi:transposase
LVTDTDKTDTDKTDTGPTVTGKRVQIWFEDEARFGQQGSLTRVWARSGSRPTAVRQTQYDYLWAMGAVCPATGQSVGLLVPHLDAQMVSLFLHQVSEQLDPDVVAVLLWDQAGFHTSSAVVVPENIRLLALPPYSPELNPMENLWHHLKSHFWSNRCYSDYEALLDAAQDAWQRVCLLPELIQSICAAPYVLGT